MTFLNYVLGSWDGPLIIDELFLQKEHMNIKRS